MRDAWASKFPNVTLLGRFRWRALFCLPILHVDGDLISPLAALHVKNFREVLDILPAYKQKAHA